MSDDEPLKAAWKNQTEEPLAMSEADIRTRAQKFDSTIGWRNAREYAAAALVVLFFGYIAVSSANPVKQAGAAAIVLASLFVSWRLAVSASPRDTSGQGGTWFDRYRGELVRQRDALRSVASWYLSPMLPGLALMIAAPHIYPVMKLGETSAWASMAFPVAFMGVIFGGVYWLNRVAARKLQADIDALDRANQD